MKSVQLSIAIGLSLIMLIAHLPLASAQESGPTSDEPDRAPPAARGDGIPRSEVIQEDGEEERGTEEGMPHTRVAPEDRRVAPQWLPPERQRWKLGIYAYNSDTGVIVTQVLPDSPAQRVGLERGDRIVAVGGFRVGWIENRLYPLGAELQRQAASRGHVNLLVQNVRDRGLLNLDVSLERPVGKRTAVADPQVVPPIPPRQP